jgi:hypothetical protein
MFRENMFLIIFILAGFPALRADAVNPQVQLDDLISQLQTTPDDQDLRKKIIELSREMAEKPVMPDGVQKMYDAALKKARSAKGPEDLREAITDLNKVSLMAPWVWKVYWNLGLAQMHIRDMGNEKSNLDLSFLAMPTDEVKAKAWKELKDFEIADGIGPSSPYFIDEENKSPPVFAQLPKEGSEKPKLADLLSQLQTKPNSTELRMQIIQLVSKMSEKPQLPEDVAELLGKAKAIIKDAKSPNDYLPAADIMTQASLLAPWVGDIYYNLGVIYEKANYPAYAIIDFKWYLSVKPHAKDRASVLERIGTLQYAADKITKNTTSVEGVWGDLTITRNTVGQYEITEPPITNQLGQTSAISFQSVVFSGNSLTYRRTATDTGSGVGFVADFSLQLSPDGSQLIGSEKRTWFNGNDAGGGAVTLTRTP